MSSLAIIKDDRYLEHNPGLGHPESPDRLKVIHALLDTEFSALPVITPRLATESELALIHDPFYIQTVAKTEGRVHSQLDPDTGLSARSYEIARLAAGGLLQAVDSLLTPNSALSTPNSIFAFVRPPGHHAEPGRAMGFCLFNNIAIAAEYARQKFGLQRILIADWDLHHGNGTQHAFYEDPGVLYFSSHQFPYYPGSGSFSETGSGPGEGFTVNAPFPPGFGDAEYRHVYDAVLKPIALEYRPELVLASAGFDPYRDDPLGSMKVSAEGFGALAAIIQNIGDKTCGGKVLLALEGGYNPQGLRDGVRSVLNTLLGQASPYAGGGPAPAAEQVIEKIISIQKKYWKKL
ncbi:MAG TPA: histone deacetylase [Nitrospirota bacterium]|nr:histone deacetylase [Nitrospirota bacterium]